MDRIEFEVGVAGEEGWRVSVPKFQQPQGFRSLQCGRAKAAARDGPMQHATFGRQWAVTYSSRSKRNASGAFETDLQLIR